MFRVYIDLAIPDRHPNYRLTETHFIFARMGGFQLVSGKGKRRLKERDFFSALMSGGIEVPTITEGEIRDKSKGDDIAKAITLVQTLWFAIQAANCVAQGFPVTELELTTLGHVVLNVLICWCWWKKPLNVDYPVDLHAKRDEKGVDATPQEGREQPLAVKTPKNAYKDIESQTPAPLSLPLRIKMGAYIYDVTWDALLGLSALRKLFVIVAFSIIGGLFGAIHCLAWNSTFPTQAERIVWRVAALVVAAIPGIIYTVYAFHPTPYEIGDTLKSPFIAPLMIIYCLARTCLLVGAIIDLRALPIKAYMIPSWSKFIPHIG
jgi:hypothetical protein